MNGLIHNIKLVTCVVMNIIMVCLHATTSWTHCMKHAYAWLWNGANWSQALTAAVRSGYSCIPHQLSSEGL